MKFPSGLYRIAACSSIKTKVVTLVALLLVFSLTIIGVGTTLVIKNEMVKAVDERLVHISGTLPGLTESFDAPKPGKSSDDATNYRVQIYTPDGALVWPLDTDDIVEFDRRVDLALYHEKGNTPFTLRGHKKEYRVLLLTLGFGDNRNIIAYYLPQSEIDSAISFYQGSYIWFSLIVFILAAYAVYLITAYAISPLYVLNKTAKAFAKGDYSRRINSEYVSSEILDLNKSINSMLNSLEKALSERDKTLREMKQFLADASHELRTPLVTLRGYAELYRIGALKTKEDVDKAVERIEKEAIRMANMVEDLMSLTRLEKSVDLVPLDIRTIVQESVIDISALETTREITVSVPQRRTATILGNENMLRRLLANLLSNALHYTPAGSPIEVITHANKTHVIIEVRDHGPGIPRQLREKVFRRFWRSDTSRARHSGGVGLGLAIAASIVKVHKGTIEVLRTPHGGATFRTKIPKLIRSASSVGVQN